MSVSWISSSSLYNTQSAQSSFQQAQQLFQQLGKDLQAGNLSAAQSDFTSLQNLLPQTNSTTAAQSSNPIAQAFAQLGKDLQSGNLSAAQQDFTTIQQDAQNQAAQNLAAQTQTTQGHHHHHGGGGSSEISQLFAQLGSALQSGDLSSAQQAFSSLTQQFQQIAQPNAASAESPASSSGGVSVSA
jgi:outer membrane protein assembly factor BamD (BamD/ComL family)